MTDFKVLEKYKEPGKRIAVYPSAFYYDAKIAKGIQWLQELYKNNIKSTIFFKDDSTYYKLLSNGQLEKIGV